MRFFLAFLLSIVLHVTIVTSIYLVNSYYKPVAKSQTISFAIDSFSFEKSKPIIKAAIKKVKIIEKSKKEKVKPVVEKKKIVKPIVKKKPIKKTKPKVVKKTKLKVKPVKKENYEEVLVEKEAKQIVTEETKEVAIEQKEVLTQIEKTVQQSLQTPTKKTNLPPKNTQTKQVISDFEIQSFLKKVYYIIYQHKSYPLRAKKLHIQGEVIVHFTLFSNGEISDIKIMKSSGAKFLDEHAIETIIDASDSFPKPPSKMEMKIPIKYFLKNN